MNRMVAETGTRYLVATRNAATMVGVPRLFGVTMVERAVSRLVPLDLGSAQALAAA